MRNRLDVEMLFGEATPTIDRKAEEKSKEKSKEKNKKKREAGIGINKIKREKKKRYKDRIFDSSTFAWLHCSHRHTHMQPHRC